MLICSCSAIDPLICKSMRKRGGVLRSNSKREDGVLSEVAELRNLLSALLFAISDCETVSVESHRMFDCRKVLKTA